MDLRADRRGRGVEDFLVRIAARDYRVAIVGLGYVGIPLALTASRAGFPALGRMPHVVKW